MDLYLEKCIVFTHCCCVKEEITGCTERGRLIINYCYSLLFSPLDDDYREMWRFFVPSLDIFLLFKLWMRFKDFLFEEYMECVEEFWVHFEMHKRLNDFNEFFNYEGSVDHRSLGKLIWTEEGWFRRLISRFFWIQWAFEVMKIRVSSISTLELHLSLRNFSIMLHFNHRLSIVFQRFSHLGWFLPQGNIRKGLDRGKGVKIGKNLFIEFSTAREQSLSIVPDSFALDQLPKIVDFKNKDNPKNFKFKKNLFAPSYISQIKIDRHHQIRAEKNIFILLFIYSACIKVWWFNNPQKT